MYKVDEIEVPRKSFGDIGFEPQDEDNRGSRGINY